MIQVGARAGAAYTTFIYIKCGLLILVLAVEFTEDLTFGEGQHSSGNQDQPSQAFFDALSLFDKNHGFLFPTIAPKQLPPGRTSAIPSSWHNSVIVG